MNILTRGYGQRDRPTLLPIELLSQLKKKKNWSTHKVLELLFSRFPSFYWFRGRFGFLRTQMGFFFTVLIFNNFFGSIHKAEKTFIFCASFNFNFCFWPKSGSFWAFWRPNGVFLASVSETVLGSAHDSEQFWLVILT